jgi:PncC family amidohydrolase
MCIVAYSNKIKENLLGVSPGLLQKHGAVSKQVALEMAEGARLLANTDIGIGITGIAGPAGGTKKKPVGLVYIALATDNKRITKEFRFKGSRKGIKSQTAQAAFYLILKTLNSKD